MSAVPPPVPPPAIQFLQARHFRPAARTRIDLIVMHSAEIGESLDGAEALMRGFARQRFRADGKTEVVSSAHFSVDADSVTQSVKEKDVAFHAPGANATGIGIEMCGRARQTAAEWDDEFSRSMIARTANLTAALCRRWQIPIRFVTASGLVAGVRGITTHSECSRAWKKSSHTDPGEAFPIQRFIDLATTYSAEVA